MTERHRNFHVYRPSWLKKFNRLIEVTIDVNQFKICIRFTDIHEYRISFIAPCPQNVRQIFSSIFSGHKKCLLKPKFLVPS